MDERGVGGRDMGEDMAEGGVAGPGGGVLFSGDVEEGGVAGTGLRGGVSVLSSGDAEERGVARNCMGEESMLSSGGPPTGLGLAVAGGGGVACSGLSNKVLGVGERGVAGRGLVFRLGGLVGVCVVSWSGVVVERCGLL